MKSRDKRWMLVVAFGCVAGCAAERTTRNDPQPQREVVHNDPAAVTAEQNDAIEALFKRKTPALQRCWQEEYSRTSNRKLEGDITLSMLISKSGKAGELKVVQSTLGVPAVDQCVLREVGDWTFPEGQAAAPYRRTVHLGAAF